jgi:hypothetical protein
MRFTEKMIGRSLRTCVADVREVREQRLALARFWAA